MFELRKIEVAAEFAVDPRQQIQIELRGDSLGIVVSRLDRADIFLQIDADDAPPPGPQSFAIWQSSATASSRSKLPIVEPGK